MRNSDKPSSSLKAILVAVLAVVVVVFFCGGWLLVITITEREDVEYPQTLVDRKIAIDTSGLPERPTIDDWYLVAVEVLNDSGWDLQPNLTGIGADMPCSSNPVLDGLTMHFADSYFDGLTPSLKWASVSLDRSTNTASVEIAYQALRWRHSSLDISNMRTGLYEALEIAARHRRRLGLSVNGKCMSHISISGNVWYIAYKGDGQPDWPDWRIGVDTKTGQATWMRW